MKRFVMCTQGITRGALLGLVTLSIVACRFAPPAPAGIPARPSAIPRNGLEVIGAMRLAHPSRALRSLSLHVRVMDARDSTRVSRKRVFASLPGKHRVETLPESRRSAIVRDRQRVSVFERGRRVTRVDRVDLAALVAYDLFAQSIDTTIMWLDSARVRFALLRLDQLDGRAAWVVGAPEGDTTSSQFWVDAREWRVVRVIQREPWNGNHLADVRFPQATIVRDIPVPKEVEVYHGGQLVQRQRIAVIKVNGRVPSRAFDLSRWRSID